MVCRAAPGACAAEKPTKDSKDDKDSRDNKIPDFGIFLLVFEVPVRPCCPLRPCFLFLPRRFLGPGSSNLLHRVRLSLPSC